MRKACPVFDVDCVINFWHLADYMEADEKELFYKMWPDGNFDEDAKFGHFALIDVYDKICYMGEDEVRETWENIRFYIEDCGYRFYDKVMIIF